LHGNLPRLPNALQLKALLGVEIMKTLKGRKLTLRQAHAETGFCG